MKNLMFIIVLVSMFINSSCSTTQNILGFKPRPSVKSGTENQQINDIDFSTSKISRENVRKTFKDHIVGIRDCYEIELIKYPETSKYLSGKIIIKWKINDSGLVQDPKILKTDLNNNRVEDCILLQMQSWIFEKPPVGTIAEVQFPIVFTRRVE